MKLFGFEISKAAKPKELERLNTPGQPDGAMEMDTLANFAGNYHYLWEFEEELRSEWDQISKYRTVARLPDVDSAIDDIVNESVVVDANEKPISISLEETEWSQSIQDKIAEEFDVVMQLLQFKNKGSSVFRRWYVDGKTYFQKVVSKNKKEGIKELIWLDPVRTKKIRENILGQDGKTIVGMREFYVYDPTFKQPKNSTGGVSVAGPDKKDVVKISPDAIAYSYSGIINQETKRVESYLHTVTKTANQLSYLEDSTVVYRLVRATERRVFYVDVGNLPGNKAEQYLNNIISKYRNKMVYDSSTGQPTNSKNHISMQEDIWLPRKEGNRGTEVDTLQGGQNLGEMEEVNYFRRKVYKAMKVPMTRIETEATLTFDKSSEISREELKFSKFIDRLRTQFNALLLDILKTQCILKGILTDQDWEINKNDISFEYASDAYYQDIKKAEILTLKSEIINNFDPFVGKYYSVKWLRTEVLEMTEEEQKEMDKQIQDERKEYGDTEGEGIGGYRAEVPPEESTPGGGFGQ